MKYTKAYYIILSILFSHYAQSMDIAESSTTFLIKDLLPDISTYLDLRSVARLLCTCSTYCTPYNKKNSNNTCIIDQLLCLNPILCKQLSLNDHLKALVHYAQKNNTSMFRHVIRHENSNNRKKRIHLLTFFKYLDPDASMISFEQLFNLTHNMQTYRARARYNNNRMNISLFFKAIELENYNAIKIFIKNRINIYADDLEGNTALHVASRHNCIPVARFLIKNNVNLEAQNTWSNTPLYVAVQHNNSQMIQLLIKAGADINSPNTTKNTPLYIACSAGNIKSVGTLLNNLADPNIQNQYGCTPLHIAARDNREQITLLLLESGANVRSKTIYRATALDLARREGNKNIVRILKRAHRKEKRRNIRNWFSGFLHNK